MENFEKNFSEDLAIRGRGGMFLGTMEIMDQVNLF